MSLSPSFTRLLRSHRLHRLATTSTGKYVPSTFTRSLPVAHTHFSTMTSLNASDDAGQIISETAKAEGGPSKGSASAHMQSEVDKARNAEEGGTTSNRSEAGQMISEVAREEGGTTKGSKSAKMQSELTKAQNESAGQGTSTGASTSPGAKSPAGQTISEVAKAEGGTTKGSKSAQMQSELTKAQNAGSGQGTSTGAADPTTQSQMEREANLSEAQEKVAPKMEKDPEHVTKEDASLLRSRETRAHGVTEKGGVAATAQHLAAENEKKGTI